MKPITNLTQEEVNACVVLDLEGTINENQLKQKYRELALKHHPDVGGDTEQFKKINSSYELLSKITPLVCSKSNVRQFEEIDTYLFGKIRRETWDSINKRFSKYAPQGFTKWREYL